MSGPFPEDSAARKTYPLYSGVLQYFPAALAELANHSYLGNEKHNPGEPLHWSRGKSDDHLDAAARHLVEGDIRGAAWRIMAALQLKCEASGAPMAPGARAATRPQAGCEQAAQSNGGWAPWKGIGSPPVSGDVLVEVGFRDLGAWNCVKRAGALDWVHRARGDDIIAYRVVKEGE